MRKAPITGPFAFSACSSARSCPRAPPRCRRRRRSRSSWARSWSSRWREGPLGLAARAGETGEIGGVIVHSWNFHGLGQLRRSHARCSRRPRTAGSRAPDRGRPGGRLGEDGPMAAARPCRRRARPARAPMRRGPGRGPATRCSGSGSTPTLHPVADVPVSRLGVLYRQGPDVVVRLAYDRAAVGCLRGRARGRPRRSRRRSTFPAWASRPRTPTAPSSTSRLRAAVSRRASIPTAARSRPTCP